MARRCAPSTSGRRRTGPAAACAPRWSSSRRRRRARARRRSPVRAASSSARSSDAALIWGVSIPTTAPVRRTATTAASSRAPRSPPTCGTTVEPGGTHGPAAPSSASTRPAHGLRSTDASVSASAAAASAAACSGVQGGQRRVFTRPGRGAFASTTTVVTAGPPRMSCTVRTEPPTVPVTLERPTRGGSDRDLARSASPPPRRAATISSGQPNLRSPMPSASECVPAGDAHRVRGRSRVTPVRRRIERVSMRLAARRCQGHASDPASGPRRRARGRLDRCGRVSRPGRRQHRRTSRRSP